MRKDEGLPLRQTRSAETFNEVFPPGMKGGEVRSGETDRCFIGEEKAEVWEEKEEEVGSEVTSEKFGSGTRGLLQNLPACPVFNQG
jgi:hypothetical protein